MHFGLGVPNVSTFADPGLLVELAIASEASGWDGFFVWDHLLYEGPGSGAVEPWSVIGAVAAVTRRIRIGVLVTAVPRRRPALLAQQVATIDLLSHGRCVFGAGLGSKAEEYAGFGEDSSLVERGRQLNEALALIQALWSPGMVHHRGEFFTADGIELLPKPIQKPHPPIWLAGRWPNKAPFRRAAEFDGVMPTHSGYGHDAFMRPGELRQIVDYVSTHRPNDHHFDVVMEGMSDGPEDLDRLSVAYGDVGLTWWIEKLGWWRGGRDAALGRVAAGPPVNT
jgi:alkanesulfonate monooxygenase SsuD/methylene tetrahydromethanopterin reductase-like flavin-dependent oxidoreductase (luciferase family)